VVQRGFALTVPVGFLIDQCSLEQLTTFVVAALAAAPGTTQEETQKIAHGQAENVQPLSPTAPLSHGQRALWFLWLLAPDSIAYNQSLPLLLPVAAEPALWRTACRLLVARHEVLRARFALRDDEAIQTFAAADSAPWTESDATGLDETAFARCVEAEHGRPFDLENEAPLRFHWFERGSGQPLLLITLHHIVCDAWSLEIMRRELQHIAQHLADGGPTSRPALDPPRQYRAFVHWQQALLAGPQGEQLLAFWRNYLTPLPPPLRLPTDRLRPPLPDYRGAAVSLRLPTVLADGLSQLARREDATLNVALMTLFCVLLQRLSGQREFILGAPSAGRSQAEFAGVIGYFVDPLAIPVRIPAAATFRQLLLQMREISRETLAHRDLPFMLLVEKLRLPRDPSRSPLFDVTFNFLSQREAANSTALGTMAIAQADGKFDLTLTVIDDGSEMTAALGYNLGLFERARVEGFAALLLSLGAAAVANPDREVAQLAADSAQSTPSTRLTPVLVGAPLSEPVRQPLHRAILAWADDTPQALAVVCGKETLTYGELAHRAAKLAAALRSLSVAGGQVVGVCLPRSVDFVSAFLAVLSAGAAYVPLDPAHPPALRGQMLQQARARCLLASRRDCYPDPHPDSGHGSLHDSPPNAVAVSGWHGEILYVEDVLAAAFSAAPLAADSGGDSLAALAYVIFTSGSTGQPKGVAISHAAIANYCASIRRDLAMDNGASGLVISALSADLGNTLLFPILLGGGTLHLADDALATNPVAYADYLQQQRIDYLKIVPSHLAALLHGRAPVLPRKALILGGEAASSAWLAPLLHSGACRIFNHYGPTETCVGVLSHPVCRADLAQHATLPLSRAVAGMALYLLDADRQAVAPGSPGELYIAGPGLAQGYVNDPVQSAERFVEIDGIGHTYRSGDLARLCPDGTLEILGRADRQVKIHGQRIEPGQIENALAALPEVAHCAVLADSEGGAAQQLLAWVVLRETLPHALPNSLAETLPAAELEARLRRALGQTLPAYMIPTRFLFRTSLPVTSNGKLDSAALRREMQLPTTQANAPLDPLQARLAHLWREILALPQIGLHEDFFQAGGHSLLAVRLVGRIADEFGVRLPLATLLTQRTIAELALCLADLLRPTPSPVQPVRRSPLLALQEGAGGPPLILLPGAGGNLLYFNGLVRHLTADLPIWGLQAIGLDDGDAPPETVEALAARYVELLQKTSELDGKIALAGHSFGGLVAYEIARQLTAAGRSVSFLGVLDNPAPAFDDDKRYSGWSEADWLRHIALRIGKLYGVAVLADGPQATDDSGQRLFRALRDAALLPIDTKYEYFDRFIAVYRANVIAAALYRPKGLPLNIPFCLFAAGDDDQALARSTAFADTAQGWQPYVDTPVRHYAVPGTHLSMLLEPHVASLAAQLNAELRSVLDRAA
jgi:amino acid adenylation domain-containing protein